jgi:lipoprotein NlpD
MRVWGGLSLLVLVAACSSPRHPAPVEDRGTAPRARSAAPAPAPSAPATPAAEPAPSPPLPGSENAGKPGYYTVRPGDTLIRIGLEHGQNWRDIARWNSITQPNLIEVGQVLRIVPPGSDAGVAQARALPPAGPVEVRPLDGRPAEPPAAASSAPGVAAAPASAPAPLPAPVPPARSGDEDVDWLWPAAGPVLTPFDDVRSKGLSIGGKAGDPVLAAADGRVVYAGSGLRGYGNLVIVKHNNTFLTAYAHNQTLLVKEDEPVRRGQKIAEMGSTDAQRVQLHFEIRRQGKPIDPARLLPPR